MKCPKCGYKRQKRDDAFVPATECPSCGVVYCKHDVIARPGLPISTAGVSPSLRKSALDPESLKKAQDRVEKKLRDRLEPSPDKDERHARTLELARKITQRSVIKPDKREVHTPNLVTDKTTPEDQNDLAETAEDSAHKALPLKDVVGIQLHDGTPKAPSETMDAESDAESPSPDEVTTAPSAPHRPDARFSETLNRPESEPAFDETDDVQTETVVLETATEENSETSFDAEQFEAAENEHAAQMSKGVDLPPAYMAESASTAETTKFGAGLKRLLPIVAWLILFSGVVGAVLSWTTISDVEAGVTVSNPNSTNSLPLGLLLGFAYLTTGALGFAFFWVSSTINRQLSDIRQLLIAPPGSHAPEDPATDLPEAYEEISS